MNQAVQPGCTIPSTAVWPGTNIPACSETHTVNVGEHTQWKRQGYSSFLSHLREIFYVLIDFAGDVFPKETEKGQLMGHGAIFSHANGALSQSPGLLTVHSAPGFLS